MKKIDTIVIVVLVVLVNGILYIYDKPQSGPAGIISSSITSNGIVVLVVGSIYCIWRRKAIIEFFGKSRK